MSASVEFPALSFSCPKLWSQMQGDEKTRFCDVCQKNVHNLSMMNKGERRALMASTGESPCVAYFKHLNDGTPIDVTALSDGNSLKQILTQAALVSLSSMTLMTACSKSTSKEEAVAKERSKTGYPMMLGIACPPAGYKPGPVPPTGAPGGLPPSPLRQ